MYCRCVKSFLEFFITVFSVVMLSPLLIFLVVTLAISLRGNPFFRQVRGGFQNRPFKVLKFRTMTDANDCLGNLLPDSDRLTTWGRFVRNTSLDELPQLFNVLMGDMSLVGPRPLFAEYDVLYTESERHRHDVKPGITGWAQVNGRNAISWKERFKLDLYYVQNCSFKLDLHILLLTIVKVVKQESIDQSTHSTMEKYDGTN